MNDYKPYTYMYKIDNGTKSVTTVIVVQVPGGQKLDQGTLSQGNTVLTYNLLSGTNEDVHVEERRMSFTVDSHPHTLSIKIGSGTGGDGGRIQVSSAGAEG